MSLITGPWTLKDLKAGKIGAPKNGLKVFSCFHCGGGSSMGYKLAGFDVLGGVEIDPKMMAIYRKNLNPVFSYEMPIQEFKLRKDIPEELFNLDILDGSPPCSSFSMAGSREDAWGENKKFREGQAKQILDDLFFHFIDVAKILKPKIVIAENVKGLIIGNAKGYVKEIFEGFRKAGYETQLFLFNASKMGVPQARERTFFIARRIDLNLPKLIPMFNEPIISARICFKGIKNNGPKLTEKFKSYWSKIIPGKGLGEIGKYNAHKKIHPDRPALTQTGSLRHMHWKHPRYLNDMEIIRLQSFPEDYNFLDQSVGYVCGMSVPPFMMQRVAKEIHKQLLTLR